MKYETKKVKLADIVPAPWNPRPEITPESVADLAASIANVGVLHNIGIWPNEATGEFYIIYGNRRVAACQGVKGLAEIEAKVYQCTEAEAQLLTRIENELRQEVEPLRDAELLGKMRGLGMNEKEIAAHTGKPIATVCRRLKLLDLAPCFREAVAKGFKISTDALERLSAYTPEIQAKVCADVIHDGEADRNYTWSSFDCNVRNLTLDLDEGEKFEDCKTCAMRTGATPDLFNEIEDGCLGRCLDPDCHKRHLQDVMRRRIADAIDPNVKERVKLRDNCTWMLADAGAKKSKPDAKNPTAYYVVLADGTVKVAYGPSKAEKAEKKKREKAKREEAENKDKAKRNFNAAICEKVGKWCKGNFRAALKKYCGSDPMKILDVSIRFGIKYAPYWGQEEKNWAAWSKRRTFDNWYKIIGVPNFRDEESGCFGCGVAREIFTFFKDVKWATILTKDELAAIRSKDFGR